MLKMAGELFVCALAIVLFTLIAEIIF